MSERHLKDMEDHHLDRLFRDKLEIRSFAASPAHWDEVQQLLEREQGSKKRRFILWAFLIGMSMTLFGYQRYPNSRSDDASSIDPQEHKSEFAEHSLKSGSTKLISSPFSTRPTPANPDLMGQVGTSSQTLDNVDYFLNSNNDEEREDVGEAEPRPQSGVRSTSQTSSSQRMPGQPVVPE